MEIGFLLCWIKMNDLPLLQKFRSWIFVLIYIAAPENLAKQIDHCWSQVKYFQYKASYSGPREYWKQGQPDGKRNTFHQVPLYNKACFGGFARKFPRSWVTPTWPFFEQLRVQVGTPGYRNYPQLWFFPWYPYCNPHGSVLPQQQTRHQKWTVPELPMLSLSLVGLIMTLKL